MTDSGKPARRQWVLVLGVVLIAVAIALQAGPLDRFGLLLGAVGAVMLVTEALLRA